MIAFGCNTLMTRFDKTHFVWVDDPMFDLNSLENYGVDINNVKYKFDLENYSYIVCYGHELERLTYRFLIKYIPFAAKIIKGLKPWHDNFAAAIFYLFCVNSDRYSNLKHVSDLSAFLFSPILKRPKVQINS